MPPKRKASSELSDNPHTVKARTRLEGRNPFEILIEKAKASDQSSITYHLSKLKETTKWTDATKAEQDIMRRELKDDITHRRIVDGKHASVLAKKLGYGKEGGRYARVDDNDPEYEDCEEEDEKEREAMWQRDDIENGEKIKLDYIGDFAKDGLQLNSHQVHNTRYMHFNMWRREWWTALESFHDKSMDLCMGGLPFLTSLGPYIDYEAGVYYDIIPPHIYFTKAELTIWRNMQAWGLEDTDWVELPGPASWWDNYDFDMHGFGEASPLGAHLYHEAFLLVLSIKDVTSENAKNRVVPVEFNRVKIQGNELRMMTDEEILFSFDMSR